LETAVKRLYEGMFLVDSGLAAQDWQKVIDEIQRMMKRAEADVVSLKKWDDRRMTYNIEGKSRGTYILVYFNCDPEKVKGVERDVQLSEIIMRVMILRTDRMSQADFDRPTPAETAPAETAPVEAAPAEEVVTEDEVIDDEVGGGEETV
jgi:small subunit ribosomal protein S6